jgi:integrase
MSWQMRGTGTVYQRGATWWIQYSHRGKVQRESSHSSERKDAVKLLKKRTTQTSNGQVIGPSAEKVTLGEMLAALMSDYRIKENRTIATVRHFARNLLEHFGADARAIDLTADKIAGYIEARQRTELANASINRETSSLRHAFGLMVSAKRLIHDHVPSVPKLPEASPRRGFLEPADFVRLQAALPAYLREPAKFLYLTGWRKGAMRSLMWMRDTELEMGPSGTITGGTIELQPENSKNKKGSRLRLKGELLEVIRAVWSDRKPECPFIFHNDGLPIGDFRKAWKAACKAANLNGLLVHDLRRSCARNLVRAGVPERVAMSVTGHLTRSMFDRYNIVAESDLESAMERVSEYVKERALGSAKIVAIPRKVA